MRLLPTLACVLGLAIPALGLAQTSVSRDALFTRAEQFANGEGVLQDFAAAVTLFQQAAELGHLGAANQLARYYFEGRAVKQDHALALSLFAKAAESEDPSYIFDHAKALEAAPAPIGNLTFAADQYRKAAGMGHTDAAVNLAVLLQSGQGVPKDLDAAIKIYSSAAKAGHPRAQNNLGLLYVRGEGVLQDYTQAARLFEAAAQTGLREAIANLGTLYANGFGVPQSDAQAEELFRLANQAATPSQPEKPDQTGPWIWDARLGPRPDQIDLAHNLELAQLGDPIAQHLAGWAYVLQGNFAAASRQFEQAAHRGHGASMANLGILFFQGAGVIQDYVAAWAWMSLGKRFGSETYLIEQVEDKMTEAQRLEAQTFAIAKLKVVSSR